MKDLHSLFRCLSQGPDILENLLAQIPETEHKKRKIAGKWSIHEHACHLAVVHEMIIDRFKRFKEESRPSFSSYRPGENISDADLINMDLETCLEDFKQKRKEMLVLLEAYQPEDWQKEGDHPQYKLFTPYIFLRHVTMHDHLHMYRIEELWLSRENYLQR